MTVDHMVVAIETTYDGAPGWLVVNLFSTQASAEEAVRTYAVKLAHQKYRIREIEVWA